MQTRVKFAALSRRWSRLSVISRGKTLRPTTSGSHSRARQLAITFDLVAASLTLLCIPSPSPLYAYCTIISAIIWIIVPYLNYLSYKILFYNLRDRACRGRLLELILNKIKYKPLRFTWKISFVVRAITPCTSQQQGYETNDKYFPHPSNLMRMRKISWHKSLCRYRLAWKLLTLDELQLISFTVGAWLCFTHWLSPDANDRGNKFKTGSFDTSSNTNYK